MASQRVSALPRWRVQLAKSSSELKAREVMPSKAMEAGTARRERAPPQDWPVSAPASRVRKRVFLPFESSRVNARSGNMIASGTPGMPPPLPTSSQLRPLRPRRHHAQAVEQMARDHLVRIAHGGQVIGLVPLDQQRRVGQQQSLLAVVEGMPSCPAPRTSSSAWDSLTRLIRRSAPAADRRCASSGGSSAGTRPPA